MRLTFGVTPDRNLIEIVRIRVRVKVRVKVRIRVRVRLWNNLGRKWVGFEFLVEI